MTGSSNNVPDAAGVLIQKGQTEEAVRQLKEFVSAMPADWRPMKESEKGLQGAFWDMEEFLSYVAYYKDKQDRSVSWVQPSYSKGFYYLAYIHAEWKDWPAALHWIDQALQLEPDHPLILSEKAMILHHGHQLEESCELYMQAADVRPWAPAKQKARVLRGAGCVLIDRMQLDEAESFFRKSLELEPENPIAANELDYIEHLRAGGRGTGIHLTQSDGSSLTNKIKNFFKKQ